MLIQLNLTITDAVGDENRCKYGLVVLFVIVERFKNSTDADYLPRSYSLHEIFPQLDFKCTRGFPIAVDFLHFDPLALYILHLKAIFCEGFALACEPDLAGLWRLVHTIGEVHDSFTPT